jgi:hypothetical protein
MDSLSGRRRDAAVLLLLLIVIAATRWPLAPDHLFFFDSVNFALALDEFNPAIHQPQPPGYPMFVALTRLLHVGIARPEAVFLTAGILGAAAAAYFLWRLAGVSATVLFVFHPVLIFGGLTNQVRIFYAFVGCGTAWLAWRAWDGSRPNRLLALGAFVGFASGFRPASALLMLPLLAAVLWRHRQARGAAAASVMLYAAGICCWLIPAAWASGGALQYVALIRGYANEQFGSSLFYDAPAHDALRMAAAAVIWPGMGVLAWIWAVPLAGWRNPAQRLESLSPLLALWFIPSLFFFATVHVADPDQSLLMAPVYCIAGGAAIDAMIDRRSWHRFRIPILVLAAAASFYVFLRPPRGIPRASGYGVIRYMQARSTGVFGALDRLRSRGPLQILVYHPVLTWRKIAYYQQSSPVYVVEDNAPAWMAHSRHRTEVPKHDNSYLLRPGTVAVVMAPAMNDQRRKLMESFRFHEEGPVIWRTLAPGESFSMAGSRFVTVP